MGDQILRCAGRLLLSTILRRPNVVMWLGNVTADPSTSLRFAQDDSVERGLGAIGISQGLKPHNLSFTPKLVYLGDLHSKISRRVHLCL